MFIKIIKYRGLFLIIPYFPRIVRFFVDKKIDKKAYKKLAEPPKKELFPKMWEENIARVAEKQYNKQKKLD